MSQADFFHFFFVLFCFLPGPLFLFLGQVKNEAAGDFVEFLVSLANSSL